MRNTLLLRNPLRQLFDYQRSELMNYMVGSCDTIIRYDISNLHMLLGTRCTRYLVVACVWGGDGIMPQTDKHNIFMPTIPLLPYIHNTTFAMQSHIAFHADMLMLVVPSRCARRSRAQEHISRSFGSAYSTSFSRFCARFHNAAYQQPHTMRSSPGRPAPRVSNRKCVHLFATRSQGVWVSGCDATRVRLPDGDLYLH